jgi:hypothetical protein
VTLELWLCVADSKAVESQAGTLKKLVSSIRMEAASQVQHGLCNDYTTMPRNLPFRHRVSLLRLSANSLP